MATQKGNQCSEGSSRDQQADKMRKRGLLFIQQFQKEAQERLKEMEAKRDNLLASVDRAFKIEMMKLPLSYHTTLVKDLLDEKSMGEVTMAIMSASPEISKPLSRKPSKKGQVGNTPAAQRLTGQIKSDNGKKRKSRKKMQASNSTGSLRSASTAGDKRAQGRVLKLSDQAPLSGGKMRPTRSFSCDLSGFATATITTSQGETLLLSDDNKDEVKLELLDDQALCQMQKIKELMEYLCTKVKMNNTH